MANLCANLRLVEIQDDRKSPFGYQLIALIFDPLEPGFICFDRQAIANNCDKYRR